MVGSSRGEHPSCLNVLQEISLGAGDGHEAHAIFRGVILGNLPGSGPLYAAEVGMYGHDFLLHVLHALPAAAPHEDVEHNLGVFSPGDVGYDKVV